jgi:MFS family permease
MTYVVLPFQMYSLTRSALAVGLIGVVEFVPMLTMALIGGALADHFDRRRLIVFVEFAMVLCCAVLAWNAALPTPYVAVLWIVAGLLAGLGALHRPSMEALVQQVLPVSEMIAVGALNSVRGNFAFIVGPGLAAFGFARSLWLALIFLAAAGAADMVSGVFRMAVWNQTIPSSIRGRTAAIEMVSYHRSSSMPRVYRRRQRRKDGSIRERLSIGKTWKRLKNWSA